MVGRSNVVELAPRGRRRVLAMDLATWRAGKRDILRTLEETIASLKARQTLLCSRTGGVVLQELSYVLAAISALDLDEDPEPERFTVIATHLNELHDVLQRAAERLQASEFGPPAPFGAQGSPMASAAVLQGEQG